MLWRSKVEIDDRSEFRTLTVSRAPSYVDKPLSARFWLDISKNEWWVCIKYDSEPYLWLNLFEKDLEIAKLKADSIPFNELCVMKDSFDKHIRKFDPYNLDGYDFKYEFRKVAK